ncbi:MAG: methanol dehydrogenase [Actinomycetia bacterium]|nr:methanol dehydrogenase [Actinomycetes bacterium]
MRRFFVLVLVLLAFAAPAGAKEKIPGFSAPVVDTADVVPAAVEQRVDAELVDFQQRTGRQIAVAVVPTTGSQTIEDYSIDVANDWGVGSKDKDDGVLLMIAVNDRKLRIEVGSGLEGELTDVESKHIIDDAITPRLKEADYGGAVELGAQELRRALGDTVSAAPPVAVSPVRDQPSGGLSIFPFIVGGIFLLSLLGGAGGRRRRNRWGLGGPIIWGGGFGGGGFGGGGFGGGGGGGGFGGGGGGGFSGGGASGGW